MTGFGAGFDPNEMANASSASYAQGKARTAQEATRHLENRVQQLSFVCQAMWQLIQEQTNLTENDLIQRVHTIQDHYENNQEETANSKPRRDQCPECGRTMSPRHDQCMYCGADRPIDSAFDLI
jgi:ribosomal protein S27AE